MSRDIETNWTLLKLTCELLEDRSILKDFVQRISHCLAEMDIKTRYKTPIFINPTDQLPRLHYEHKIRDLTSGRPNLPLDLYYNDSLFCLEKVPPVYSQQSKLNYYNYCLGKGFQIRTCKSKSNFRGRWARRQY